MGTNYFLINHTKKHKKAADDYCNVFYDYWNWKSIKK